MRILKPKKGTDKATSEQAGMPADEEKKEEAAAGSSSTEVPKAERTKTAGAPPAFGRARSRSTSPGKKQRVDKDDGVVFVEQRPASGPWWQEIPVAIDKKPALALLRRRLHPSRGGIGGKSKNNKPHSPAHLRMGRRGRRGLSFAGSRSFFEFTCK